MKFTIRTLGCKVNQYETEVLRENLERLGLEDSSPLSADVFIINSCTVTEEADSKTMRIIRRVKKDNPRIKIFVTGCCTVLNDDINKMRSMSEVYMVVPGKEKMNLPRILESDLHLVKEKNSPELKEEAIGLKSHTRAFLKIQDGCDQDCSYCKVRIVRGRSVPKDEDRMLDSIINFSKESFKEIVLTGICLGAWQNGSRSLTELLEKIEALQGDFRLRLSSIEPNYITDSLIDLMSSSKRICRHLHIPLQSGSDKILRAMNRKYTALEFAKLIERIRKKMPLIGISMDVMTAFPGESENDFKETLIFLKKICPSRLHVFRYSDRKGTRAYTMKDKVLDTAAKERTRSLVTLGECLAEQFSTTFIGRDVDILTEKLLGNDMLEGYTGEYVRVKLRGSMYEKGKIIRAKGSFLDLKDRCLFLERAPEGANLASPLDKQNVSIAFGS